MTPTQIILLIAAILVLEALIWIPVLAWLRRKSSLLAESLKDSVALSGDRFIIEPEGALYRGGTGTYSRVKGNGVIALTDRRLIFKKLVGGDIEIPLGSVEKVSESKWFLRSYRSGRLHLILHLRDGSEVGFIIKNHDAWMRALESAVPQDG